jgi:hypothetical protein
VAERATLPSDLAYLRDGPTLAEPDPMRLAYAALALALAPACTLHFGDGDDIVCLQDQDDEGFAAPAPGLLNPFNLQCEYFGGGGGCGAVEDRAPTPSWGSCLSECGGLDEAVCVETAACRTAYDHNCLLTDGPCPALTPYLGCFPTDTTGPVQGTCEGLDAQECSRHDDCLATYTESGGIRQFQLCLPELRQECGDCG